MISICRRRNLTFFGSIDLEGNHLNLLHLLWLSNLLKMKQSSNETHLRCKSHHAVEKVLAALALAQNLKTQKSFKSQKTVNKSFCLCVCGFGALLKTNELRCAVSGKKGCSTVDPEAVITSPLWGRVRRV